MRTKSSALRRFVALSVLAAHLATLLPISIFPASATPTTCYVVENGVLTNGTGCSGDVVIDSSVTSIGTYNGGYGAFQGAGITSVTIPSTVTSIGYGAFWYSSVRSINFAAGSTLASVERWAFANTPNLSNITLPDSSFVISSVAFSGSAIRYIIFEGAPPQVNNYNANPAGSLQGITTNSIAWVRPGNLSAYTAQNPKIMTNVRSFTGNTPPPTIFSPTDGSTLTTSVSEVLNFPVNFYGVGSPTLEVITGSLPPGITLNQSGLFVGTSTTTAPLITRTYPITLRVIDGVESSTSTMTFEVLPPSLPEIESETYTVNVGIPVNKSFYSNARGEKTISVVEGSLPPGISLSNSYNFVGTPTNTGTYSAKLRITDPYSQSVTSDNFIFQVGSTVNVNISASKSTMDMTYTNSSETFSVISSSAPDDFIICGFYKDADDAGGLYQKQYCNQKQYSNYVSQGISSDEDSAYFDNTTWVIRAYGPDASQDEDPDIDTPYLATVTVAVNLGPQIPTITIDNTSFDPGINNYLDIAIRGFDTSLSYQATIKFVDISTNVELSNGTLFATQGGTSLISGYNSYSAPKLGFKGTYAAVATALSSVSWTPATGSGNISIRIGISQMPNANEFYDANSGHYYRFVSTGAPWLQARTNAETTFLYGLRGYLAEINSSAENSFIGVETTATNVWIGASDRATEGSWIWDGATSSYVKPTGSGTNAGRTATYHSWSNAEPNDFGRNEDCAVTNWQGVRGKWNDLPCANSYKYLIEFGGRPGETSTAIGTTLTTTVVAEPPVQYTITYDADGGSSTPTSPSRVAGERFVVAGAITKAPSGGISYLFAGWNNGTTIYKAGQTATVESANVTLTAEWILQYEVTYLSNGGAFAGGDSERESECTLVSGRRICTVNQGITLNSTPSKTGFDFLGWQDSTENLVEDTDPVTDGVQTTVVNSRYIFSARWAPIAYTVVYVSSGSTAPIQSSLNLGETFTVASAVTRTGYEFSGWDDGNFLYQPDSAYTVGTSAITLTAQWTPVYTVTYSAGLGSGTSSTDVISYYEDSEFVISDDDGISRSGFRFSGWSDGTGTFEPGDEYTIGTVNVTLTAVWSEISAPPSRTQSSSSIPNVQVKAERETLQINVARNQSTYLKLFTSDASAPALISDRTPGALISAQAESISSSQSANLKVPGTGISFSREVLDEFKSRVRIKISANEISVTPVRGFTGILVVPVAATIDGVETVVLNKVIVNPAPPVAQKFAPTAINRSAIAWAPSASQVLSYQVAINGKTICQTTATSCPVEALIGPKSIVTLTAQGNDKTVSTPVVVPYVATRPIPALKVNFAIGSAILSNAQKIEIRSISRVIDAEGFTKLVVSGFTDSSGSQDLNQKLSAARAKAVAIYMRTLLPTISIKASAFGKSRPVSSNASKSGQAQNRRTEIATW